MKSLRKTKSSLALFGLVALLLPGSAAAHVTLQPSEAAAEDYVVFDVRVPNESDSAATDKVDVQFPPGFPFASYQPVPGWSVKVATRGGEVSRITWTADSAAAAIEPGQFQDFPISVQVPGKAGAALTFKALQSYDDGEVVRWIGAPDSDHPAPQVSVTEAAAGHHGAPASGSDEEEGGDQDSASSDDSGDSDSNGLAIAALALGAVGLVTGGVALRRSKQS